MSEDGGGEQLTVYCDLHIVTDFSLFLCGDEDGREQLLFPFCWRRWGLGLCLDTDTQNKACIPITMWTTWGSAPCCLGAWLGHDQRVRSAGADCLHLPLSPSCSVSNTSPHALWLIAIPVLGHKEHALVRAAWWLLVAPGWQPPSFACPLLSKLGARPTV